MDTNKTLFFEEKFFNDIKDKFPKSYELFVDNGMNKFVIGINEPDCLTINDFCNISSVPDQVARLSTFFNRNNLHYKKIYDNTWGDKERLLSGITILFDSLEENLTK